MHKWKCSECREPTGTTYPYKFRLERLAYCKKCEKLTHQEATPSQT